MRCTINFNVQGSKEQEKKKVSFYSRHLALSRCVGSANFDYILGNFLQVEDRAVVV